MFDFFLFFLSFLLFKPIKPLLLFFFLLLCWLIGCRVHWNCTWTEHLNDKKWTTAAFRIQRKKLLFYSGWVILQRPAALLIILKTQPAVHMWCEEKSIRRVPESRRAVRGRLQFTSLRQQNKKKNTHLHDEIYSLIGRGAEIAWQTGGAVLKLMLRRFVSHRRELKRLFCHHFFKSVIMSPHR